MPDIGTEKGFGIEKGVHNRLKTLAESNQTLVRILTPFLRL